MQDQPVAGILLDEFARREVVLEIDDHCAVPWSVSCGLEVSRNRPLGNRAEFA
jgi:hypothetical protein